jgi:hypothetical protein
MAWPVLGPSRVNARNRVFMILGLLTMGSLIWYLPRRGAPAICN